jgi:hypothetical protein
MDSELQGSLQSFASVSGLDACHVGRGRVDETALVREDDRLHPVAKSELGQEMGRIGLHGPLGDVQALRPLGVRESERERPKDLQLRFGEPLDLFGDVMTRPKLGELLDDPSSDRRCQEGLAGRTTRIALIRSSGGAFFSRKPLAPATSLR